MMHDPVADLLIEKGQSLFNAPRPAVYAFTRDADANALLNNLDEYPHAYVIACIMNRRIKNERAWLIPCRLSENLGNFAFTTLESLTKNKIRYLLKKLHYLPDMAGHTRDAIRLIREKYSSDASEIWKRRPSSAEVVYRFLEFNGVGPKIATMAANILAKHFKIEFSDYYSIDVSVDRHLRRVFSRLCLVPEDAKNEQFIYRARSLYPMFPGIVDFPAWDIGTKWCKPKQPICRECYMNGVCPTARRHLK